MRAFVYQGSSVILAKQIFFFVLLNNTHPVLDVPLTLLFTLTHTWVWAKDTNRTISLFFYLFDYPGIICEPGIIIPVQYALQQSYAKLYICCPPTAHSATPGQVDCSVRFCSGTSSTLLTLFCNRQRTLAHTDMTYLSKLRLLSDANINKEGSEKKQD